MWAYNLYPLLLWEPLSVLGEGWRLWIWNWHKQRATARGQRYQQSIWQLCREVTKFKIGGLQTYGWFLSKYLFSKFWECTMQKAKQLSQKPLRSRPKFPTTQQCCRDRLTNERGPCNHKVRVKGSRKLVKCNNLQTWKV